MIFFLIIIYFYNNYKGNTLSGKNNTLSRKNIRKSISFVLLYKENYLCNVIKTKEQ